MPAKYQTIGGVATLVQHRGPTTLPGAPPDISGGPVVLCLHESGMGGGSFAGLLDALAPTHSPIAFDRPGHGRSGGLDAIDSVPAMAEHAAGLLEAYGLDDVIVVGEGTGSAVAIELAVATPTAVAALVLIGGAAASHDVDAEIEALAAITAGRARREFDRTGYAPDTDRSVYQRAFGVWVKTDPRATLGERRALAAWSLGDRAASLTCPVTVVIGDHEEDAWAEAARALAGSLPRGDTATLAGAGRRGVLEQPEAVAALIGSLTTTGATT
ncbi:MAG: alpha/beta hydrolase [Actinomycetota bacterium]